MPVYLIDKIQQFGGGTFKLLDAEDLDGAFVTSVTENELTGVVEIAFQDAAGNPGTASLDGSLLINAAPDADPQPEASTANFNARRLWWDGITLRHLVRIPGHGFSVNWPDYASASYRGEHRDNPPNFENNQFYYHLGAHRFVYRINGRNVGGTPSGWRGHVDDEAAANARVSADDQLFEWDDNVHISSGYVEPTDDVFFWESLFREIPDVVANPDGDDGDNLERIRIGNQNFMVLGAPASAFVDAIRYGLVVFENRNPTESDFAHHRMFFDGITLRKVRRVPVPGHDRIVVFTETNLDISQYGAGIYVNRQAADDVPGTPTIGERYFNRNQNHWEIWEAGNYWDTSQFIAAPQDADGSLWVGEHGNETVAAGQVDRVGEIASYPNDGGVYVLHRVESITPQTEDGFRYELEPVLEIYALDNSDVDDDESDTQGTVSGRTLARAVEEHERFTEVEQEILDDLSRITFPHPTDDWAIRQTYTARDFFADRYATFLSLGWDTDNRLRALSGDGHVARLGGHDRGRIYDGSDRLRAGLVSGAHWLFLRDNETHGGSDIERAPVDGGDSAVEFEINSIRYFTMFADPDSGTLLGILRRISSTDMEVGLLSYDSAAGTVTAEDTITLTRAHLDAALGPDFLPLPDIHRESAGGAYEGVAGAILEGDTLYLLLTRIFKTDGQSTSALVGFTLEGTPNNRTLTVLAENAVDELPIPSELTSGILPLEADELYIASDTAVYRLSPPEEIDHPQSDWDETDPDEDAFIRNTAEAKAQLADIPNLERKTGDLIVHTTRTWVDAADAEVTGFAGRPASLADITGETYHGSLTQGAAEDYIVVRIPLANDLRDYRVDQTATGYHHDWQHLELIDVDATYRYGGTFVHVVGGSTIRAQYSAEQVHTEYRGDIDPIETEDIEDDAVTKGKLSAAVRNEIDRGGIVTSGLQYRINHDETSTNDARSTDWVGGVFRAERDVYLNGGSFRIANDSPGTDRTYHLAVVPLFQHADDDWRVPNDASSVQYWDTRINRDGTGTDSDWDDHYTLRSGHSAHGYMECRPPDPTQPLVIRKGEFFGLMSRVSTPGVDEQYYTIGFIPGGDIAAVVEQDHNHPDFDHEIFQYLGEIHSGHNGRDLQGRPIMTASNVNHFAYRMRLDYAIHEADLLAVTADDIDSESATDGQVLTADGAGGSAWEDPAAGGAGVGAFARDVLFEDTTDRVAVGNSVAVILDLDSQPAAGSDIEIQFRENAGSSTTPVRAVYPISQLPADTWMGLDPITGAEDTTDGMYANVFKRPSSDFSTSGLVSHCWVGRTALNQLVLRCSSASEFDFEFRIRVREVQPSGGGSSQQAGGGQNLTRSTVVSGNLLSATNALTFDVTESGVIAVGNYSINPLPILDVFDLVATIRVGGRAGFPMRLSREQFFYVGETQESVAGTWPFDGSGGGSWGNVSELPCAMLSVDHRTEGVVKTLLRPQRQQLGWNIGGSDPRTAILFFFDFDAADVNLTNVRLVVFSDQVVEIEGIHIHYWQGTT